MMKNQYSLKMRKIQLFLTIFLISIFVFQDTKANPEHNVSGWAWSENVGWISFNCKNQDSCGTVNYGVDIDPSTGIFSGYAWSENIGWISFNTSDLAGCPISPCQAKLDLATNKISGWAKALTDGGGWDGWIRLREANYGLSLNPSTSEIEGWAWSDQVVGWISFNCKNQGICATSNYKVTAILNRPPQALNPNEIQNSCAWGTTPQVAPGLSITLNWNYSDPDGDPQSAYEIWLDDSPAFSDPKFNNLVSPGISQSYALNLSDDDNSDWLSQLNWNKTYYWKVRVRDSTGNWSNWSSLNVFTTPLHASPYIDFGWDPKRPTVGEVVLFTNQSECYNSVGNIVDCSSWYWEFQDGNPSSSTKQNATTTFTSTGSKTVTLKVTDFDGLKCAGSKTIQIGFPLPEWREIPPLIWLKKSLASIFGIFSQLLRR